MGLISGNIERTDWRDWSRKKLPENYHGERFLLRRNQSLLRVSTVHYGLCIIFFSFITLSAQARGSTSTKISYWVSVGGGAFSYNGKSSEKGSFSASAPMSSASVYQYVRRKRWFLRTELRVDAIYLSRNSGTEIPITFDLRPSFNRNFGKGYGGFGFGQSRLFFFYYP